MARQKAKPTRSTKTQRLTLLQEREQTHGNFRNVAETSTMLKLAINTGLHVAENDLTAIQREALDVLCTKLARIACGDPNELQHWDDVVGYAELVREELRGEL